MSQTSLAPLLEELGALLLEADPSDTEALRAAVPLLDALLAACAGGPPELEQEAQSLSQAWRGVLQKPVKKRQAALDELARTVNAWLSQPVPRLELPEEVDDELLAQFVANTKLGLEEFESDAIELTGQNPEALARIKRRLHTWKGEAGMMGLVALERLCHATETFLEASRPGEDRNTTLLAVKDTIASALTELLQRQLPTQPIDALIRQLLGEVPPSEEHREPTPVESHAAVPPPGSPSAPEAPPPAVAPGSPPLPSATAPAETGAGIPWDEEDNELVAEFLHESRENLAVVDQSLLEIEQAGPSTERINNLFRVFHTLKGVAGFLHLEQVTRVAHVTETMLDRVRTGALEANGAVLDLVFDSTSVMRELSSHIERSLTTGASLMHHDGVGALLLRLERAIQNDLVADSEPVAKSGEKLGEILVREGLTTEDVVADCLEEQKQTGRRLGESLIAHGSVAPKDVAHALRAQKNQATAAQAVKIREVVKVDLERVDRLVETIGELVIVESMVSHAPELRNLPTHLRNSLSQFAKITRELQEIGMRMRMMPVRGEFQKMTRMVRDLAKKANKQVRVDVRGEGTEMDRSMVEQIADPLVHLIRNAVDHGIEPAEQRLAQGKSPVGTIVLSAAHEGGSIVIEISDDGKGIDRDAVLAKAISRGLVKPGIPMTDSEVFDLIFMPGFSTAAQVTEISGRGVGMDVVKRNIEAMRGRIVTTSTPGRGSTFRLALPLTLAIIDGMVVRCGEENFILPTQSILESLQPQREMLSTMVGERELIVVRGNALPLLRLSSLLTVEGAEQDPTRALVVIVETLSGRVGLLVDEVVTQQQVVIKSVDDELNNEKVFSGAAIMSNGRVGLILHLDELVARADLRLRDQAMKNPPRPVRVEMVA